jgi:hypothetical protein
MSEATEKNGTFVESKPVAGIVVGSRNRKSPVFGKNLSGEKKREEKREIN